MFLSSRGTLHGLYVVFCSSYFRYRSDCSIFATWPYDVMEFPGLRPGTVMADDDTDCTLCYEAYSDSDEGRIPRNLSCGHTYCTGDCMPNSQGVSR